VIRKKGNPEIRKKGKFSFFPLFPPENVFVNKKKEIRKNGNPENRLNPINWYWKLIVEMQYLRMSIVGES